MNPSREASARRKRERVQLEIGVAETAMPKSGAQRDNKKNHANKAKADNQEYARIIATGKPRDEGNSDRNHHQITKNAGYPGRDFGFLVLTFRAAICPVHAPQPR